MRVDVEEKSKVPEWAYFRLAELLNELLEEDEDRDAREREDKGKVPDDFPALRARGRIYSEGGKPYMPYYDAREVWKYFRGRARKF